MDHTVSVIFGVVGMFIGYNIPNISSAIMVYKRGIESIKELKDALYINILFCLFIGLAWGYSFYQLANLNAFLIAIQITLGIIIAYIDIKIRIIPNELVLAMTLLGIVFQSVYFGFSALIVAMLSMVVMMITFAAVAGFVGFGKVGAGDVKLAGAMGLSLGYPLIITAVGIMAVSLIAFIFVGMTMKKIFLSTMLPFAPFMIIGYIAAFITLLI